MFHVPNNSVGLAFTSPPYNVGKEFDEDLGLVEYLTLIANVATEVYRVLTPGGRYVINLANLGRIRYILTSMEFMPHWAFNLQARSSGKKGRV
jgi:site-specific DNA-methyltransferase (adenine-specific)